MGDTTATMTRLVAAAAVLVSGLVHLQLWFDGYRDFPDANLGRSFLLNAIASIVIAAALAWRRELIVRLAAIGLLVATLVAFLISRTDGGIFGLSERGLNPSPQAAIALVAELLGLVLLIATLIPAVGPGRELPPVAGLAAAGGVAVIAVVGAVLFARSDDPEQVSTATSLAATTTTPPPTTVAAGGGSPATTAPGAAPATTTTVAPATTSAGPAVVTVSIADFAFVEDRIEVPVGTTVEWVNDDSFDHSVVADDDSFTSEVLGSGDRFSFTFTAAGEFPYVCGIHPSMLGTVVVTA